MSTQFKYLLTTSLTAFTVGFVGVCGGPGIPVTLAVGLPVGAIFFGLLMIAYIFEGETAKFDAEERARLASVPRHAAPPSEREFPASSPMGAVTTLPAAVR